MIRRIYIDGYKSFRDFTLELKPLSVIFGPNSFGKSNLLDSIELIGRFATSPTLQKAFENHRGKPFQSFYCGTESFNDLMKKERLQMAFEVDVLLSDSTVKYVENLIKEKRKGIESSMEKKYVVEPFLRYRLVIEGLPNTGYLRVKEEKLSALRRDNSDEKKTRRSFIETSADSITLRLEGQGHPTSHELGLDHTIVSKALYEPHYPHIAALKHELAQWRTYYFSPEKMRESEPVAEEKAIAHDGSNLIAFLNVLKHKKPKAYDNILRTVRHILPQKPRIDIEVEGGMASMTITENQTKFPSSLISEGTLRVVGLVSVLSEDNNTTVIAFEEPENGIHPIRLRDMATMIRESFGDQVQDDDRQIILTSHSPVFPDLFDDESLFICKRENGLTRINPFKSKGQVFKRSEIDLALEDRILRGDFGG